MYTYIINVRSNTARQAHTLAQIRKNTCLQHYEFIHDGDLETITPEIYNRFFGGLLSEINPAVSCAYKHFLAYEAFLKQGDPYCFIIEDDLFFEKDFCTLFTQITAEITARNIVNFIISIEDSLIKYVKGSVRKKGVLLYSAMFQRGTGAYIIDRQSAQRMIQELYTNKCLLPIDLFHNYCAGQQWINLYWSHPTLASQGSNSGHMTSLIDNKKVGYFRILSYKITKLYKRLTYALR